VLQATKFIDIFHCGSATQSVEIDTVGLVVDISVSSTSRYDFDNSILTCAR